jgi:solute:Na+ symporter, SSS family
VLLLGAGAAWLMRGMSVDQAGKFLAALGAGTGAVFMLRWYWWRVNAWTEIAAMVASLVFFVAISGYVPRNEHRLAVVGLLTIITWLAVTLVTKPESDEVLHRFYRKIRPGGPGWKRVARSCPDVRADEGLRWSALAALFATGIIYLGLPGVGLLIFGDYARAALALGGAGLCAVVLGVLMRRMGWESLVR